MKRLKSLLILVLFLFSGTALFAQSKTIAEKTTGMDKYEGFFTFYWDDSTGSIWLEIDKFESEFLYLNSVSGGLSTNGIDRNGLGQSKIVKFQRIGPKILMIQPNYSFRAITDDEFVIDAVENAFGRSVIWGFKVAAEENGRVLVDASKFFLRDAQSWAGSMAGRTGAGSYRLDESKSAFDLEHTKNFPDNSEIDAILTFTGKGFRGSEAPSSEAITVKLHHSLVKLPDDNYSPRKYDPRSSFMGISYMDFAVPISDPINQNFIRRHRLDKKNPESNVSEAIEPIVYYVDRGVPAEIRDAVLEGASWWNQAFEACGYKDAFQVKLLPKDTDPMDIRYNMINWINRSSRGWSYGSAVTDPRTGEIIKGNVSMGALRIRQVYLMATGLIGKYSEGNQITPELKKIALQRIKQLSAHEVGHTLGLVHNYASNIDGRSSVMDYPHSLATIDKKGNIDLSKAYTNEIGEWDKISIAFGYQDFPVGTNSDKLAKEELDKAFKEGIYYLTDKDAGAGIHPYAHQWVNGKHPVDELDRVMKIRKIALDNFSEKKIRYGEAMSTLEDVFVPVYFYHRFQISAAASVIGGLYYNHALRGGPQYIQKPVTATEQKRALKSLLETLKPENLVINRETLDLIPPRAPGHNQTADLFSSYTGGTFDPLAAAENIADHTISAILNPARAARVISNHSFDPEVPGLKEVIDDLVEASLMNYPTDTHLREIQRVVNIKVLNRIMALAVNSKSSPQTRAICFTKIIELQEWTGIVNSDPDQAAHFKYIQNTIDRFLKDPEKFKLPEVVKIPNGAPIGG